MGYVDTELLNGLGSANPTSGRDYIAIHIASYLQSVQCPALHSSIHWISAKYTCLKLFAPLIRVYRLYRHPHNKQFRHNRQVAFRFYIPCKSPRRWTNSPAYACCRSPYQWPQDERSYTCISGVIQATFCRENTYYRQCIDFERNWRHLAVQLIAFGTKILVAKLF